MNVDAVKAAIVALVAQVVTLLVGYGVVDNAHAAQWSAITVAVVGLGFQISHALHNLKKPAPVAVAVPVAPVVKS